MPARLLSTAEALAALDASPDMLAGLVAAVLREGPGAYVANAHARVEVIEVGGVLLPLTVPTAHPNNSYVVSPLAHYVHYAREELPKLGRPRLERALGALLGGLGGWFERCGLDRTVYVNNALVSTNLWPRIAPSDLREAVRMLAERFPDRAVAFRSVDAVGSPAVLAALAEAGGRRVPSRMVYYQDARRPETITATSAFRKDLRLMRRTPYRLVAPAPADAPRIEELYRLLYLDKYSTLNPRFTVRFFERAIRDGWLVVRGFEAHGRLDAVLGYFVRDGTMTQPLFGYDTALPLGCGLYRLLSTQKLLDGMTRGLLVHASAGAGGFKRRRGGAMTPEYLVVFDRHLPPADRLPWALLGALGRGVGIPLLRRYEL